MSVHDRVYKNTSIIKISHFPKDIYLIIGLNIPYIIHCGTKFKVFVYKLWYGYFYNVSPNITYSAAEKLKYRVF